MALEKEGKNLTAPPPFCSWIFNLTSRFQEMKLKYVIVSILVFERDHILDIFSVWLPISFILQFCSSAILDVFQAESEMSYYNRKLISHMKYTYTFGAEIKKIRENSTPISTPKVVFPSRIRHLARHIYQGEQNRKHNSHSI